MGATRSSVGCLSLSQNGIIRQHKTQALMGATRLASGKDADLFNRVRIFLLSLLRRETRRPH